ncbi:diguanylate cyclase domain-containing protein [Oceanispirochaeta sp. M1]|uniref:sensor domain-containing diguanylate cyclase n=1 Tax=Oceanispirochaeta sp. M1 TaxID=2283433 RepID=UPI0014951FED
MLTDKIPIGSGEFLTPEYDQSLMDAGVFPWFWDLKKKQVLLTPNILKLISEAEDCGHYLYPVIQSHLNPQDAKQFFKIIKAFIRLEKAGDYDFQIKSSTGLSPWMRISGTYLKEGGEIIGIMGNLRNINESVTLQKNLLESRNFLDTLINLIPLPIYYKNLRGEYEFFNKAFSKLQDMQDMDLIGSTVYDLYSLEQADEFTRSDQSLFKDKEVRVYDEKVTFRDGKTRELMIHKAPDISSEDSEVKGLAGFILDMTEQNKAAKKISRLIDIKELVLEINHAILSIPDMESLLEFILKKIPSVVKNADCGTILLHKEGVLTVTASYGYEMRDFKNFSFPVESSFMYKEGEGIPKKVLIINDIQRIISEGNHPPLLPTKKGNKINSFMGSPIIREGRMLGLFSLDSFSNNIFREEDIELMDYLNEQLAVVLDKQELYQKVLGLSRFDSLTGLSNRHYFQEQAQAALSRAGRTDQTLVILLADIDSLKPVNDYWGHEAGDSMICSFSTLLKESFRDSDILGRMGGDEFTAVFHDTDRENLEARFNNFRNNPELFDVPDGKVACRFSFGTAEYPTDSNSLDELIKIADQRMYDMKENGKRERGILSMESLLLN